MKRILGSILEAPRERSALGVDSDGKTYCSTPYVEGQALADVISVLTDGVYAPSNPHSSGF